MIFSFYKHYVIFLKPGLTQAQPVNYNYQGKLTQKRESVHPEAICNDENDVEVEGEIKIRTQRYEDTLTVKTIVKEGFTHLIYLYYIGIPYSLYRIGYTVWVLEIFKKLCFQEIAG